MAARDGKDVSGAEGDDQASRDGESERQRQDLRDEKDGNQEIERLHQDLREEKDRNLRLLADFDNYRRRVTREKDLVRHEGQRAALLAVLPVLDALERALAAGSTDPDFYEGVGETYEVFVNALREAGAEPIETVGLPFDPKVHDAVSTVPSEEVEPGTITREVRRGWRLANELLRPAQVVVATAGREDLGEPWL